LLCALNQPLHLLQVNVFELGHTYLQLVQTLNLRLPLVDPSHYISRFAALLEFGDETHKVATDAIRLVQRFDRDWMTKGRRPAGICGACLLLAARMNNFRRSVEEIVQVVKIADTTLRKRLKEFKETPSGALTLTDFRTVWLEEEMDPPAFIKGKEKERATKEIDADEEPSEETGRVRKRASKVDKRKRKRRRVNESDEEGGGPPPDDGPRTYLDPVLLNSGILAGTSQLQPLFLPEPGEDILNNHTDPMLLVEQPPGDPIALPASHAINSNSVADVVSPLEVEVNNLLTEEVAEFLLNEQGAQLSAALNEANERRIAAIQPVDELAGLDEEELDQFLMSEEEVRIRERVWVEMNREYLEAIAGVFLGIGIKHAGSSDIPVTEQRKENNMSQAPHQLSIRRFASSFTRAMYLTDNGGDDQTASEIRGETSRRLNSSREHGRGVRPYPSQTEYALQQANQLRCPQGSLHG
jgi:transcription factor IIIB 90 kDa subunit